MALDIEWTTGVITIPRADMPVVQVSPEIRELDVNQFHQDLRTVHATVEGAPYPQTHVHVQEYTLSGITYARAIRILIPYSVTFEDGQYGVNVVGGNTNLLDVKNANQVSLLGNNSAGVINITELTTLLKYARNRLVVDEANSRLLLYDDDLVTLFQVWDLTDKNGNPIVLPAGVQAERGGPQL